MAIALISFVPACEDNPSTGAPPPGFGPSASSSPGSSSTVQSPPPRCAAPGAALQDPACVVIPSPVPCIQPAGLTLYSGSSSGLLWQTPPFTPTPNFCTISIAWSAKCFECGSGYPLEVVTYPGQEIVVASTRALDVIHGASGLITVDHTSVPAGSQLFLRVGGDGTPDCKPASDYECVGWTVSVSE
jgi:hypothetical protein